MKTIFEVFPEMFIDHDSKKMFIGVHIKNINMFTQAKKIELHLVADDVIPYCHIVALEKSFEKCLGIATVIIHMCYLVNWTISKIMETYWDSFLFAVSRDIVSAKAMMDSATYKIQENRISVFVKSGALDFLKMKHIDLLIEKLFDGWFSKLIKVDIIEDKSLQDTMAEYLDFKENQEISAERIMAQSSPVQRTIDKPKTQSVGGKESKESAVVMGKFFMDDKVAIREVTLESGKVSVSGEIFSVEFRELKGGKYICVFDMTDTTSSITIKFFSEKEKVLPLKERIKEGICVKVRGTAQYDTYAKELALFANDIIELQKEVRMDTAENKRVELHLHTQMSAMDAITPAKELVKMAASWGHRAIAITDHGVLQAYPDAMEAGKKHNIKIVYGMECYLLDDSVPIVYNEREQSLDDVYVVFDVETTGLHAATDKITEIGAVRVVNGQVVDQFSTFVNPEVPIPDNIQKLTGITDEMVKDGPLIEQALQDFLTYAGEACFVAHNASFDMGFMRLNARKIKLEIQNPVLDTLALSRKLFPTLAKHKLGALAKHLGISLENAHRACDDAKATAEILIHCMTMLKDKGIQLLNQIQVGLGESADDYTRAKTYHAIILVKDYVGLKNMYKLVSSSHLDYFYKKPRVPKKLLLSLREGLILGSACEAGELFTALLEKKNDNEIRNIVNFYDYLEIQPIQNNQFLINKGTVANEKELMDFNRKIVQLGEKYSKPVVATCDVHFMNPKDEVYRRILMAGQGFSDADNQAPLFLRTTDEMLKEFKYLGEEKAFEVVVTSTNKIADMTESIIPIPDGTYPPCIEGAETEIKTLAENKAREVYGQQLPEVVEKRLEKELNSIIKNGFSVMYIIAQKLVWKSISDGYLVGSRGSVGSSFVANMVGITEVNSLPPHYICTHCKYSEFIAEGSIGCGFDLPEKNCPTCGKILKKDGYDIPFETFLGFDGDKEPDIDLNFSGEYQPIVHRYTEELFGKGHVFKAGTIATIAEKTAYGFVKGYVDERNINAPNAEINRLVKGCTGVKKTTGQHPGGLMIVPQDRDIYQFCPIQRPADDSGSSIITTHFDYHSISGRLLKLDLLGHDDPTAIRMLEDLTGVIATEIPIGDKKTMNLFASTESLGVNPEDINSDVGTFAIPEFGTKFVRQMLVDTRPTTFSELIRISGLSHGTDVWLNNAQELVRNGTAALSEVICTRDDIMLYLIYAGLPPKVAFKIMEDVRKGKGVKEEYEEIMKENKVPRWYIESCKKIKYMFPKAHAAAYVMMAFRIAWFKVYYPEAFYVTYFTVRADEFDAELMAYGKEPVQRRIKELESMGNTLTQKEKNLLTILEVVNEMYARGIKFSPIALYHSDAVQFLITKDGILPPFKSLQGLGISAAHNIILARADGEFISKDDLRVRAKIGKAVLEILERNNCLKGLPETSQLSLF